MATKSISAGGQIGTKPGSKARAAAGSAARNTSSAKAARSGTAKARAAAATSDNKVTAPLRAAAQSLVGGKLAGLAGKLIEGRRKDLEAIVAANRKSYEGVQAVVERQSQLLKAAISEWKDVAKLMAASGPKESISKLDELAKSSFRLAIANLRELAELAVKSQAEAFDVVKKRVGANIDELNALLERG